MLASRPGFSAAVIFTLAVGIGANVAVFSVLNGYLVKPLPYPHSEQLVEVNATAPKFAPYNLGMSVPMYVAIRDRVPAYSSVAEYFSNRFSLRAGGRTRRVNAQAATGSLWQVLGVHPLLGRVFNRAAEAPGRGHVVVLSYRLWRSAFGGDPNIVGKRINLSGKRYRVIGVMPSSFVFPRKRTDLWLPMTIGAADLSVSEMYHTGHQVIGRLAPGASMRTLKRQLQAATDYIHAVAPADRPFNRTYFVTIPYRQTLLYGKTQMLLLLQGAVLLVLLIACINIANLLLSRILARGHEIAMRSALGASRAVLARQLLIEGACLAAPGAILGLGFGWLCLHLLGRSALNPAAGGVFDIAIDWRVGLFGLGAACLAAVLASLLPVRHLAKTDLHALLQEGGQSLTGGRGARRARDALVTAEIALATLLLAGAGLLLHSFINLQNVDTGFDADHVVMASLLPPTREQVNDAQLAASYRAIVLHMKALPGARFAAVASTTPFGHYLHVGHARPRQVASQDESGPQITYSAIYGDYFKALGIPFLAGRNFTRHDAANGRPVAIIGAHLAGKFFGKRNAIGKQITLGYAGNDKWLTIIGVVPPVRMLNLEGENDSYDVYLSALQFPGRTADLVVRAAVQPDMLGGALRKVVAKVDPRIAVFDIEKMHQRLAHQLGDRQITLVLVLAFGGLALLLAMLGIYGVLSHAVGQRANECGVRLALGALPEDLLWMVIRDGLKLLAIGLIVGLGLAVISGFVLSSWLFGVAPYDPLSLIGAIVVLAAVTLAACYLPARRAARLDPVDALRS